MGTHEQRQAAVEALRRVEEHDRQEEARREDITSHRAGFRDGYQKALTDVIRRLDALADEAVGLDYSTGLDHASDLAHEMLGKVTRD